MASVPQHLFATMLDRVHAACAAVLGPNVDLSRVVVEPPKEPSHGDMATNAAMVLAKDAGKKPRELAEAIAGKLHAEASVEKVDVAGPGFINLTLKPHVWAEELRVVLAAGNDYGRSDIGKSEKVNVEYVSANPTGPMHVGHGRGAVFGDALANLLAFAGYDVTREYYINDAGAQVDVLARSAFLRYREALGEDIGPIPDGLYPGDYLKPVGGELAAEYGAALSAKPEAEWLPVVRAKAIGMMMASIRDDLAALNVRHDVFFSERSLIEDGDAVARTVEDLRKSGEVYEGRLPPPKGGNLEDWEDREQTLFRSTAFGDDVDRPLKKSDGSYTYFASDIAYHKSKVRARLPQTDRRLGRRPRRLYQAHAGGGEGGERGQGHARRETRAAGAAVARRRAGENVEALGRLRHLARSGRRSRQGCRALRHALPQERRGTRFRPRQGDRGDAREPGVLRAIRPRPRPVGVPQRARRHAGICRLRRMRAHASSRTRRSRNSAIPANCPSSSASRFTRAPSRPPRRPMSRTGLHSISMN